ncbi:MAG TPA: MFS transporter [Verrucomicrobiae bacterium]|nr:MFS transporter [Verrucomicrobiae bacterium]
MTLLNPILKFFLTGPDATPLTDEAEIKRRYRRNRISVFLSITFGYAVYYVIRQSYAIVKKPLLDAGVFDAAQLGKIGSVFFFTYMIGKCLNGFLADRLNIKRFLALGLLVSSALLVAMGFCSSFYLFAVLWGLCGWFQTFGAAPCVVSLNQWFSRKERGTLYGIWFAAHNIGTYLAYRYIPLLVAAYGWHIGFVAPGLLGIVGAIFLYAFMYDRPEVYGLPPSAVYEGEQTAAEHRAKEKPVFKAQFAVIVRPAVWILGLSSAACYITRYAFESWGVVFLTEAKGYSLPDAGKTIGISQIAGIVGAVTCGLISDRLFDHKRQVPCLLFGIFFVISSATFVYVPAGHPWMDYFSMVVFGYTVYALVAYLGGLMAVELCSKKATGAAMGMIGLFSYAGASLQELVGGHLINAHKTILADKTISYDFTTVGHFWVIASVFALVLPLLVWNAKPED